MHCAQLLVQAAYPFELFLQLLVNHDGLLPG
jgi:hypothetical protein